MTGFLCPVLYAVTVGVALLLNPTQAEEYSLIVRNGEVKFLPCLAAGESPYKWKAFRVEGNNIGPPIDIRGFETNLGDLGFITDDAVNTGVYECMAALDESVVFDKYVILTESERLWISPSPTWVNSSGKATIGIHFLQFEGTPEHPYAFLVNWTSNNSSEILGLISELDIVNGTAYYTFSAIDNGSISVVADYTAGHVMHRVTSNTIQVILETGSKPVDPTIVKEEVPPEIGPGTITSIACGAVALLGLLVIVVLTTGLYVLRRRRNRRHQIVPDYLHILSRTEHHLPLRMQEVVYDDGESGPDISDE